MCLFLLFITKQYSVTLKTAKHLLFVSENYIPELFLTIAFSDNSKYKKKLDLNKSEDEI